MSSLNLFPHKTPQKRSSEGTIITIVTLVLLAAFLRLIGLHDNSLWIDEYTSIEISAKSLSDIINGRGFDSHTPPFYYVVLHFWQNVFGSSEVALRSLSVLFDVINVVLVFYISRTFFCSFKIATYSAFLYSISPYAVFYAQDGRMYTLLVCLCLLTALAIKRYPFNSIFKDVTFVVLCILGMYTHYYYALFLASLSLYLLFFSSLKKSQKVKYCILSIVIGVSFLPWLQVIRKLLSGPGQDFREYVWTVLPYTFFRYVAGYGNLVINTSAKRRISEVLTENITLLSVYYLAFGFAFAWGLVVLYKKYKRESCFIIFPIFIPACLALVISHFTPMLSERYLIVSYPFFLIVLSLLIEDRKAFPLLMLTTGLFSLAMLQHIFNPDLKNTEWREATSLVNKAAVACDNVSVNPKHFSGLVKYYLKSEKSFLDPQGLDSKNVDCVWYIERGTSEPLAKDLFDKGFDVTLGEHYPYENELTIRLLNRR